MTPTTTQRRPKLYFDTDKDPSHVTFDDGKQSRHNLPWTHYVEARWDYDEPDTIRIEIGEWVVVMRGHNLGPLYLALEDRSLLRVRAQPAFGEDSEREHDTFVTELRLTKPPASGGTVKRRGQTELDLGG